MRDVAYVVPPAATDLDADGFADLLLERVSPLAVPDVMTDTDASPTDNDAQGEWAVEAVSDPDLAGTGGGASSAWALGVVCLVVGACLTARSRVLRRRSGRSTRHA